MQFSHMAMQLADLENTLAEIREESKQLLEELSDGLAAAGDSRD